MSVPDHFYLIFFMILHQIHSNIIIQDLIKDENGFKYDGFSLTGPSIPTTITSTFYSYDMIGGLNICGRNCAIKKTYTNLPIHNQIKLMMTYYTVYTWDNELIRITLDQYAFSFSSRTVGGHPYSEWYTCKPVVFFFNLPHTSSNLSLLATSGLDQDASDEALGISSISIIIQNSTGPIQQSSCGIPTGFSASYTCACSISSFKNQNGICTNCHSACTSCFDFGIDKCYFCSPGFYLNSQGACLLSKHCSEGDSNGNCVKCESGYQLFNNNCIYCGIDTYIDDSGACQKCSTKFLNCNTCTKEFCTQCNTGYLLSKGYLCYPKCSTSQIMTYDLACTKMPNVSFTSNNGYTSMEEYSKGINDFQKQQGINIQKPDKLSANVDIGISKFRNKGWKYKLGIDLSAKTIDCSNLVHQIYAASGYNYPYTSTSSWPPSQFVEITKDKIQPGDVILFEGHMGIVLNNQEFFGSQSSTGPAAAFYGLKNSYWGKNKPIKGYYRWKQ